MKTNTVNIENTKKILFSGLSALLGVLLLSATLSHANGTEDMALIPMGEFTMGDEMHYDSPPHPVVLDAYYIDKYEVSNARYAKFMEATGHAAPAYWDNRMLNKPMQPVVGVNWFDAKAFCTWEGKRLPSEAEWEKAAKGPEGNHYPWGHEYSEDKSNCCQNVRTTSNVDAYPKGVSGYGVFNMGGNVYEWVEDWYDPKYYVKSRALNPKGPEKAYIWGAMGEMKVLRGGSWFAPSSSQHTSHRFWNKPENNSYGIGLGFRCAKDASGSVTEETQQAFMKSLIFMGSRKTDEALNAINTALKLDPENTKFLETKALIQKMASHK